MVKHKLDQKKMIVLTIVDDPGIGIKYRCRYKVKVEDAPYKTDEFYEFELEKIPIPETKLFEREE